MKPWEYLPEKFAHFRLQNLVEEITWEQNEITLFGKTHPLPRLEAWYGEKDYSYSNKQMKAQALPPLLVQIKNELVKIIPHWEPNTVLCNLYRDGEDSMGWHRDNEKELGARPTIASLSFGESRIFKLRHRTTKNVVEFYLGHGDLLIMKDHCQDEWEHSIAKSKKVNRPRVNLTFRYIL